MDRLTWQQGWKHRWTLWVFAWTALGLLATVIAVAGSAPEARARNPILWMDVPDVAVIRVGDTYYMSSTTMHMSPGLPLMRSRDLVQWELVNYAHEVLEDSDALSLRNGQNAYGGGSWASSLRYHNGTYYVTTFSHTTGRTYVFQTDNIEKGSWRRSSFRPALHDHSLHFEDDGRVFMVHGAGDIWLTELEPDLSGIKPGGIHQVIISNASRVAGPNIGLPAEGSQLRKIRGKYYLNLITWPRGGMRTQLIFRSDRLTGPYEGRVALQDRGVAQGGLIDTPDGRWFALLFQDHGAVGRTPFLVPVRWEQDWPVYGVDGKVPDTLDLPAPRDPLSNVVISDEFDRRPGDPPLPLAWQWNHNPDPRFWSVTERPGWLRLRTGRVDRDLLEARNTLTQRTFGPECAGWTRVDVSGLKEGDHAGLALLQRRFGQLAVVREDGQRWLILRHAEKDTPVVAERIPYESDTVWLGVVCDFRNLADVAQFHYSQDGRDWKPIGPRIRLTYTLPHFMGYRFALFAYATREPGGHADFDFFRVGSGLPR
ncbi:glycosyl hydrolase 43 family protein [Limisphaera ngatamarikiensis]|uniref:Glycosyl hydrolase 43 family protein n=1 Tax=Limisphaera ngatamarikiensis TaxID=1324935 RepID=A0A6M1RPJ2_9BACT|nr:glycoside hydrolase 43 family protein [Limisphaera ngatamarikiensis]NGO39573.1 glycosyl hydrolase 43 family protein [Limisphaera ngatamarikiensis]